MLELTVRVRDGGSPPRSAIGRLTVVVDALAADPDGEPVIVPSLISSSSSAWILRLTILVASALGAAVLATVILIVVVSVTALRRLQIFTRTGWPKSEATLIADA